MIISLIPAAAYADDGADVSAALENIVIESTADDNFVLPTDGAGGVSISWTSSDKSAVLPVNGTAYVMSGLGKKTAVLTASAQKGGEIQTKQFEVEVLPFTYTGEYIENEDFENVTELDPVSIVKNYAASIDLGDISNVVKDLEMPEKTPLGDADILWVSSNPEVISTTGKVNNPKEGDSIPVTLWALVESDGIRSIKRFDVNVLQARRGRRFNVFAEGNKGRKI